MKKILFVALIFAGCLFSSCLTRRIMKKKPVEDLDIGSMIQPFSEADRKKFSQHGCDANSIVGDPLFVDPQRGDYRVKPDSPALKMGFENFPMDRFGVKKPELKAMARTPAFPIPQIKQ